MLSINVSDGENKADANVSSLLIGKPSNDEVIGGTGFARNLKKPRMPRDGIPKASAAPAPAPPLFAAKPTESELLNVPKDPDQDGRIQRLKVRRSSSSFAFLTPEQIAQLQAFDKEVQQNPQPDDEEEQLS
jgi:hypothetical protein